MSKVFKFGGSSIKGVESIKNVSEILFSHKNDDLFIIFSAMGKVTNMLEDVLDKYVNHSSKTDYLLQKVKDFHYSILDNLFEKEEQIYNDVNNLFVEIEWVLEDDPNENYDYDYDQIVSVGELISTKIMSSYLNKIGFKNNWIDARDIIKTDNTHRFAKVNWSITEKSILSVKSEFPKITQGFIGCTSENFTTTLGREGSDFSAAIIGYCINATEVVIWKDVDGLLNSDPRYFENSELLEEIPFTEAIELAYYGAKVIHPKTIYPLKRKSIPLFVKSFISPNNRGTIIKNDVEITPLIPSYIVKENQILISISDNNLSFIVENHLSEIFNVLSELNISVNLMQNSAVSFSICIDNNKKRVSKLIKILNGSFNVYFNDNLTLFTIRHYDDKAVSLVLKDKELILEQKSRNTVQIVVKQ